MRPRVVISLFGGIGLLIVGLCGGQLCVQSWVLAAHANRYIDAELEVVEYHRTVARNGEASDRNQIKGVIHPGGIPVWTNDDDVTVSVFDSPGSMVGRKPIRSELEGKRIPVRYWPNAETERGWFSPPAITNADLPRPTELWTITALAVLAVGGCVWCFRYVRRHRKLVEQPTTTTAPSRWPRWTLPCVLGCGLFWPVWGLAWMAFTQGYNENLKATERIPWTPEEWARAYVVVGAIGVPAILCTLFVLVAVWKRVTGRPAAPK